MNIFKTLCLLLVFTTGLNAQSLKIRDHNGKVVNGDTVVVIFHPNSNHGWTELSVEFFVQNMNNSTLTLGAKKTEYNMRLDEYHSICFGLSCFDSATFVSPFKVPLISGGIDSSFSGHYRFDDLLHPPGRCYVAYTFYDDNNSKDSAIVYVEYNTMQKAGFNNYSKSIAFKSTVWPNPASDLLYIKYNLVSTVISNDTYVEIFNSLGECVKKQNLFKAEGLASLDIKELIQGMYYVSIVSGNTIISHNKFQIMH